MDFFFEPIYYDKNSKARRGRIHTPHGSIETPSFVPVGTQATIKSLDFDEVKALGTQVFFVNTYHMYLRPGIDVVRELGGLHTFMNWNGPIMTDSGGFQVFSLAREKFSSHDTKINGGSLVKITEEGVTFQSHWDGSSHMFTPSSSMAMQHGLESDIHIVFDDCTSYPVTHKKAQTSLVRTHRWAVESLEAHKKLNIEGMKIGKKYQALYGSVQGSIFEDLRIESAKFISSLDVDGIAVGGVSVGESKEEMVQVLNWVVPHLPQEKPRHLLGVGEIDDIFALVERGMDTFDCVQATRWGRMGQCIVPPDSGVDSKYIDSKYTYDITNKDFERDSRPLVTSCGCYTCTHHTRAYVHHLFRVRELLSYKLLTMHNMYQIHTLVTLIRDSLENGSFLELKRKWLYNRG